MSGRAAVCRVVWPGETRLDRRQHDVNPRSRHVRLPSYRGGVGGGGGVARERFIQRRRRRCSGSSGAAVAMTPTTTGCSAAVVSSYSTQEGQRLQPDTRPV